MCHQPLREVNIQSNPCLKSGAFVHIPFHILFTIHPVVWPPSPLYDFYSNGQLCFLLVHHPPPQEKGTPSIEPPYLIPPPKKKNRSGCLMSSWPSCGLLTGKPARNNALNKTPICHYPPNKFSKSTFQEGWCKMIILWVGGSLHGGYITSPEAIHNFANHSKPDLHGLIPNMGR